MLSIFVESYKRITCSQSWTNATYWVHYTTLSWSTFTARFRTNSTFTLRWITSGGLTWDITFATRIDSLSLKLVFVCHYKRVYHSMLDSRVGICALKENHTSGYQALKYCVRRERICEIDWFWYCQSPKI